MNQALTFPVTVFLTLLQRPFVYLSPPETRPFMPELYAWKSAKWLTGIDLIEDYEDGYWEAYGYHERGLVSGGERYTNGLWRRVRKTVTGKVRA